MLAVMAAVGLTGAPATAAPSRSLYTGIDRKKARIARV
jgi:hypothetical protein